MTRRLSSVAAIAAALVIAEAASIAGCAVSNPPDLTPDTPTGLPGLDASYEAAPATSDDAVLPEAGSGDGGKKDASALVATDSGNDAALGPPKPAQGEVLITEVMYNPSGSEPRSEWFEVRCMASASRSLGGLTILDGAGRTHVIAAGTVIAPGEYVLFVRDTATATAQKVPAAAILYEYGTGLADTAGVILLNGATGSVSLHDGATQIAQAPYGGWFSQSGGHSVQLKILDYAQSASPTSWCLSGSAWTAGSDMGTPGAASDCP
jgi:hypothetical protein